MKGSAFFSILCPLLHFLVSTSVLAGVSGNSETRFLVDNSQFGEAQTSIEQWTSINYKEIGGDLFFTAQFAVEAGEESTNQQLYQCFLRSGEGGDQPELTIGRFAMSNVSGFNALDGFSVRQQLTPLNWQIYAGKPRHMDGYEEETADLLLGFATQHDLAAYSDLKQFNKLLFNLGLEKVWSNEGGLILRGGLSGERHNSEDGIQLSDFQLAVDLSLDDKSLRRAFFDTHIDLHQQGQVRVGYHYYQPDEDLETFRDRFHGIYNMQRQSLLKGVWYVPTTGPVETRFEISGNRHEQGSGGMGLALEMIYPTQHGSSIEGRSDYLEIDDDRAIALYFRYRQPVSSFSILQVEGVYQTKQTLLSGRNRLTGFSLSHFKRLRKQLFLDLSGEWLDHSDRDDEYRLGMTLRYDFYQTNTGELP
jgi:hypothetical protein